VITSLTADNGDDGIVPLSVGLQSDGSILVLVDIMNGGSETTDVVRYTPTGTLDRSFGINGIAVLPEELAFPAMAVQPNNQIVVAGGGVDTGTLSAERLNATGSVDKTFGNNGVSSVSLTNCCGTQMTIMVEPANGDILACTQLFPTGRREPYHTALARWNAAGAPDATFGQGGTVNVVGVEGCDAMAVFSSGQILVENGGGLSTELTGAGVQQSTVAGGIIVDRAGSQNPSSLGSVFQPNGDYLLARQLFVGEPSREHNASAQVLRFRADGSADPTFANPSFHFVGNGGFGIEAQLNGVALQTNGNIVVTGLQYTINSSGTTIVNGLARITPSGVLDSTFGSGGVVSNSVPAGTDGYFEVMIQPADGKIVVVGTAGNFSELTVSRYMAQ
jgi:uncharacterized delta-60 repeat protein